MELHRARNEGLTTSFDDDDKRDREGERGERERDGGGEVKGGDEL